MSQATECPTCKEDMVLPYGPKNSDVLIIRSSVNEKDKHTRPWGDGTGAILKKELYDVGLDLGSWRQAVLWNHKLIEDGCDEVCEFLLYNEMKDRKLIILVGADAVTHFTGGLYGIDEVKGLDITDEVSTEIVGNYVPFDCKFIALENPATAYVKGVGELRFGISVIKNALQDMLPA